MADDIPAPAKISRRDKIAIIRSIILTNPDIYQYGYKKNIKEYIKTKYHVDISKAAIKKYIKIAIEEIKENTFVSVTKDRIVGMLLQLFEKSKSISEKRKLLKDIAALQGFYTVDDTENSDPRQLNITFNTVQGNPEVQQVIDNHTIIEHEAGTAEPE